MTPNPIRSVPLILMHDGRAIRFYLKALVIVVRLISKLLKNHRREFRRNLLDRIDQIIDAISVGEKNRKWILRWDVANTVAAVDCAYIFQEFASQFGFVEIGIQIGVIGVVHVLVDALEIERNRCLDEGHPANAMQYLLIYYRCLCVASANRC